MGDHSESLEIEWDPEQTNYEALLEIFWTTHNPTQKSCRQYMSGIWYHNKEQLDVIKKSMEKHSKLLKRPIVTVVEPAGPFTPAENYHQKFELQRDRRLMESLHLSDKDLEISHVATRLNGYSAGHGTYEDLEKEIDTFNLDTDTANYVRNMVKKPSGSLAACHL